MKFKGDAKFKEKLTCSLKNDIRNLVNFHASSQISENLHFDGLHMSIEYKVSAKKVQKRQLSWRRKKKKTDYLFEKWHEKFGEF